MLDIYICEVTVIMQSLSSRICDLCIRISARTAGCLNEKSQDPDRSHIFGSCGTKPRELTTGAAGLCNALHTSNRTVMSIRPANLSQDNVARATYFPTDMIIFFFNVICFYVCRIQSKS